jgi:hypothetical protein
LYLDLPEQSIGFANRTAGTDSCAMDEQPIGSARRRDARFGKLWGCGWQREWQWWDSLNIRVIRVATTSKPEPP